MRGIVALVALAMALVAGGLPAAETSRAWAQDAPPDLGDAIVDDAQAAPGGFGPFTCPTGRARREFANGGNTFTITGGCQDPGAFAGFGPDQRGVTIPDGDFRVEFKTLSGLDRTEIQLFLRSNNDGGYSGVPHKMLRQVPCEE